MARVFQTEEEEYVEDVTPAIKCNECGFTHINSKFFVPISVMNNDVKDVCIKCLVEGVEISAELRDQSVTDISNSNNGPFMEIEQSIMGIPILEGVDGEFSINSPIEEFLEEYYKTMEDEDVGVDIDVE